MKPITIEELQKQIEQQKLKQIEVENKLKILEEEVKQQGKDISDVRVHMAELKTELLIIRESTGKMEMLLQKMIDQQDTRLNWFIKVALVTSGILILGEKAVPIIKGIIGF